MSVAHALRFIRAARSDENLRARIAALPEDAAIDAVSACAPEYGFTAAELAEAFRIDWAARWAHFSRRD